MEKIQLFVSEALIGCGSGIGGIELVSVKLIGWGK